MSKHTAAREHARLRPAALVSLGTAPVAGVLGPHVGANTQPAAPGAVALAGPAAARDDATAAADGGGMIAGAENASASRAAASGKASGAAQPRATLARAPRLLAAHDPCVGYFPGTAAADRGQVQLSIDVDAQGRSHPSQTLSEYPRGQGFENAAKACASHLRFAPARDAAGQPVAAQARIALAFDRS